MRRILYLILIAASMVSFPCKGQISYGGTPASFNRLKAAHLQLPVVELPHVDNNDLQLLEDQSSSLFKKQKFARSFQVDISPDRSGDWEIVDGMKIWRIAIRSKGAYSLSILFDQAILPTGASIFIYSADHQILRGAFNANNEQSSGVLPIFPLPVDEIIVEYNEPESVSVKGELHISQVNHGYKNVIGTRPLGAAGSCNMDVFCKDAVMLNKEKQSVVQLVVDGTDLCTGTLVNNTKRDKTPYLITAGHCIQNASDAQRTVYSFNYESPFCGKGESVNGFGEQSMTGSILRARSDSLDFALVELEMLPPPEFRPYYVGWDHGKTTPLSTRSVHHPKGDVKKVSIDNDAPGIGTYNQYGSVPNSYWWIKRWDIGTTEPGSSGGPLFNEANLFIGTLQGGLATCENSVNDYYVMMAYQWSHSSITTKQLKKWLDPLNTGETKIEAMNPYSLGSTCDHFSDVMAAETYELTKMVGGRGYVSGHNYLRINSYAQEFDKTDLTTISAFSVGLAKAVSVVNNSISNVSFQFYAVNEATGLPGELLKTVKIPIRSLKADAMNFVALDKPIQVKGKYFIGYDINYGNAGDTIAVYNAAPRKSSDLNNAYCLKGGTWEPFYWIPEINLKTSLLINSYGCGSTFSPVDPEPTPVGATQFKIYYPNNPGLNILYLVNTGKEEYGRVIFYDLSGHKLSEEQRMLTTTPMEINCSQLRSSVYFVAVETISKKEVLKARVIRGR